VRAGAKKRCEVCGVAFGPLSSRKRFCSQKCHDRYYAAKRRPKATCEQCGRRFQPLENTPGRFCSHKCYHDWQHEHGEGGRIDRKLAQVSARAQFLARRDLEAREAERAVPVRVSRSSSGMRIESRGNCAGGCATNIPHT
jgi:ribosomal protein L24E